MADATGLDNAIELRDGRDPLDVAEVRIGVLTRVDAAELAVRHCPELQAALAEVRASLADARQARLLSNPVLDLNIRFGGSDEVIEAGLSQPLIDLLTRDDRSHAADARLRASVQRATVEALDVLRATQRAYADAVAAEAQLAVLDKQANLLDQLLDVADARRSAGEGSRLDVVGFQARRATLDARALRIRAEGQAARLTLARLIGAPSGVTDFQLDPPMKPGPLAVETELLTTALSARPEVQAQIFELAALGVQVRLAGFVPFDGLSAGVASETEGVTSVGPSIALPVPIFDFGTQRKERARAEVLAARHRLVGISRRVIEEVRQANAAALAADQSTAAFDDVLLPLQRDRVEQTQAAYRAGFADVTDVLAAEQELLDAEAELIDARRRRELADADLLRAIGGVPDFQYTPRSQP